MPVLLPTARLLGMCNPLKFSPWDTQRVTKRMVGVALKNNLLISEPIASDSHPQEHAARIAFLVKHGWPDAIDVDVGVPSINCYISWPVTDGNHRLAAADYRGDPSILASVSGSLEYAADLFGVDCEELQH